MRIVESSQGDQIPSAPGGLERAGMTGDISIIQRSDDIVKRYPVTGYGIRRYPEGG